MPRAINIAANFPSRIPLLGANTDPLMWSLHAVCTIDLQHLAQYSCELGKFYSLPQAILLQVIYVLFPGMRERDRAAPVFMDWSMSISAFALQSYRH